MDYYKILELDSKTASHESIADNFRRLALKNHPLRNEENLDSSQREFNRICEAYEVLSNAEFKAIYDKSGISGLKNGTTKKKDGKFIGGYSFQGNSFEIFKAFFGTQDPFTDNFKGVDPNTLVNDPNDENAPKDIHKCVPCTIHEFYNGSLKTIDYTRDKILPDGRSVE
jgi:DnaJ-class molecular chaperone